MININYNFRDGLFIEILGEENNKTYDIFMDSDTTNLGEFGKWEIKVNHWVRSGNKDYVPWNFRISDADSGEILLERRMDLYGKDVFISLPESSGISQSEVLYGETFKVFLEFARKHKCIVHTYADGIINKNEYKELVFSDTNDKDNPKYYASYKIDPYKKPESGVELNVSLWDTHIVAREILGLNG